MQPWHCLANCISRKGFSILRTSCITSCVSTYPYSTWLQLIAVCEWPARSPSFVPRLSHQPVNEVRSSRPSHSLFTYCNGSKRLEVYNEENEAKLTVCAMFATTSIPSCIQQLKLVWGCNFWSCLMFYNITIHALALCMFVPDELTNHITAPQRLEGLNVSLTMEGGLAVTMSFSVSWE